MLDHLVRDREARQTTGATLQINNANFYIPVFKLSIKI